MSQFTLNSLRQWGMLTLFLSCNLFYISSCTSSEESDSSTPSTNGSDSSSSEHHHQKDLVKENRHLPSSSCSRLQYEIQRSILTHEWGLQRLKFQQRLKRHPQYIVTIQSVRSLHDPLIELRCPGGGNDLDSLSNRLELYFHESRFVADSVRLFDINSIFPVHTGALSVRIRLSPLVMILDKGSDIGLGISDIFWRTLAGTPKLEGDIATKEHRENEDLLDLEKEIEGVFTRRIQPDVQKQIEALVKNTTNYYLQNNLVHFL